MDRPAAEYSMTTACDPDSPEELSAWRRGHPVQGGGDVSGDSGPDPGRRGHGPDRVLAVAITAAATGIDTPSGWAIHGLIVGALAGSIAAPWIVRGRPLAIVALAVVLDVAGVLLFPILAPLLGLEGPIARPARLDQWLSNLGPMFVVTPIGFMTAVPFLPAVGATAVIAAAIIGRRRAPAGVPADAPAEGSIALVADVSEIPTGEASDTRGLLGDDAVWESIAAHRRAHFAGRAAEDLDELERYRALTRRARLDREREDADPRVRADRAFSRAVAISLGLLVAFVVLGSLLLISLVSNNIAY